MNAVFRLWMVLKLLPYPFQAVYDYERLRRQMIRESRANGGNWRGDRFDIFGSDDDDEPAVGSSEVQREAV